jgi:hypothetical protein
MESDDCPKQVRAKLVESPSSIRMKLSHVMTPNDVTPEQRIDWLPKELRVRATRSPQFDGLLRQPTGPASCEVAGIRRQSLGCHSECHAMLPARKCGPIRAPGEDSRALEGIVENRRVFAGCELAERVGVLPSAPQTALKSKIPAQTARSQRLRLA